MLDTLHAGIGGFGDSHEVRHVADEGNAELFRLVGDRKEHLARQAGVNLHVVVAVLLRAANRLAVLLGGTRRDRLRPPRLWPVDDRAGDREARPDHAAVGDAPALLQVVRVAPHHANAGDPVRDEERQVALVAPVHVHVPEAGDQKLASALDERSLFGNRYFAANRRDAPVAYEHGHIRPRRRAGGVDHGDMGDRQRARLRGRGLQEQQQTEEGVANRHNPVSCTNMDPTELGPLASRYLSVSDLPWKPTGHPGVEMKVLLEDKESGLLTALFRWEPGAVLPLHEHVEIEQTYVLEGSIVDDEGEVRKGDFVWRPKGNRHVARSPNGALVLGFFLKPNRFLA
jgi:quercetin dioxygenase-like cupin family protein